VVVTNSRFHGQFVEWASDCDAPLPIRVLDDGSKRVEDRRGAVGDLAFGVDAFPPGGADWVVVAGDNLIALDLRPCDQAFRRKRRPMLLLRRLSRHDDPARYNEVVRDEAGRVTRFVEKPSARTSDVTAIALYFFTPEVTELLSRYLEVSEERDAPGHFIAWLVQQLAVGSTFFDGDWFDVGSPETLEAARRALGPGS
jgi:NDP-sugar pyrophosphorylase family protein